MPDTLFDNILIVIWELLFAGKENGFVQVGPKKYFFPTSFIKHAEQIYNFEARSDDVWVATCPRSGTTMMQELVWLIANDLDYDRAKREQLFSRFPLFEWVFFLFLSCFTIFESEKFDICFLDRLWLSYLRCEIFSAKYLFRATKNSQIPIRDVSSRHIYHFRWCRQVWWIQRAKLFMWREIQKM